MIIDDRLSKERYFKLLIGTGVFVIVTGVIVIACWILKFSPLKSIYPSYISMKVNTALCFLLSGLSLIILTTYRTASSRDIFRLLTLCFGAIALVSLSQNIFSWSAGIDELLVIDDDTPVKGLPFPGRMSPSSAFCFGLLALGFLGVDARKRYINVTAQYLLHTVTVIAFIGIVGYVLRVPYTLKFSFFSLMGFNTAIGLFVLSVSASVVNHTLGLTSLFTGFQVGDYNARRLFPRLIFILLVISYVKLDLQRNNFITSEFGVVISATAFVLLALFLIKDTLTEMNLLDIKRLEAEYKTQLAYANVDGMIQKRVQGLEDELNKLTGLIDNSPVGILRLEPDTGRCADINQTLLKLLSIKKEDVLNKHFANFVKEHIPNEEDVRNIEAVSKYQRPMGVKLIDKQRGSVSAVLTSKTFAVADKQFLALFFVPVLPGN